MKIILVPIDFSAATSHVLDFARQLGKAFGAQIHLIHVREIPAPMPTSPLGYGALGMPEIVPLPVSDISAQPIAPNEEEKRNSTNGKRKSNTLVLARRSMNRPVT